MGEPPTLIAHCLDRSGCFRTRSPTTPIVSATVVVPSKAGLLICADAVAEENAHSGAEDGEGLPIDDRCSYWTSGIARVISV